MSMESSEIWLPVNQTPAGSAIPRWEMARQKPRAHFKMGTPLVIAYELLASMLAERVKLPVPRTHLYKEPTAGTEGALSLEHDLHWGPWIEFDKQPFFNRGDYLNSCRSLIHNLEDLRLVVVFDIWIRNTDRHFGNILVTELNPEESYEVVFIDHSHAFLGPSGEHAGIFVSELDTTPDPRSWLRSEELALFREVTTHHCQLEDMVHRITSIPDQWVAHALDEMYTWTPAIGEPVKDTLAEGLIRRKAGLEHATVELCRVFGKH